jgi:sRNA-binding carbon storage regulator CsrA
MPLVLSLRTGDDFFVGDQHVVIGEVLNEGRFEMTVMSSGRHYLVSDEQAVELEEIADVFISSGDRPQHGVARVAIDAPRSIPVLRGEAARNDREATVEFLKPRERFT